MIFEPTVIFHPEREIPLFEKAYRLIDGMRSQAADTEVIGSVRDYQVHVDNVESLFRRVVSNPQEPVTWTRVRFLMSVLSPISAFAAHEATLPTPDKILEKYNALPEDSPERDTDVARQYEVARELYTAAWKDLSELTEILESAEAFLHVQRDTFFGCVDPDELADYSEDLRERNASLLESQAKERQQRRAKQERTAAALAAYDRN